MTWRRVGVFGVLVAAAGGVLTLLRRRRAGGGEAEAPASDYEVRDGIIDLTGVATEEQVPDVIKGVADVP